MLKRAVVVYDIVSTVSFFTQILYSARERERELEIFIGQYPLYIRQFHFFSILYSARERERELEIFIEQYPLYIRQFHFFFNPILCERERES